MARQVNFDMEELLFAARISLILAIRTVTHYSSVFAGQAFSSKFELSMTTKERKDQVVELISMARSCQTLLEHQYFIFLKAHEESVIATTSIAFREESLIERVKV